MRQRLFVANPGAGWRICHRQKIADAPANLNTK
jgi:hypothetical protein